jgi:hypothetical protein
MPKCAAQGTVNINVRYKSMTVTRVSS